MMPRRYGKSRPMGWAFFAVVVTACLGVARLTRWSVMHVAQQLSSQQPPSSWVNNLGSGALAYWESTNFVALIILSVVFAAVCVFVTQFVFEIVKSAIKRKS